MKIKFAFIEKDDINLAQNLSSELQKAMENGEVIVVDQITGRLLMLTKTEYSLSISEDDWHNFISKVRCMDKNYKSNFLIVNSELEIIKEANLEKQFSDAISIVQHALAAEGAVLQIAYDDEEEKNV